MKRTGTVLAATCVVWTGLWAGAVMADVQAGVDAYNAGDYKRAIDEWMPAAAKNDPDALFNLGQVYRLGKGVKPDLAVAEDYYKRAAALGHVVAEGNLGALYLDRGGPLFDPKKGVAWLQKASMRGNPLSRYMLGVVYFNGEYVPMDSIEAYAWISLAAEQGVTDAVKAEQTIVSQMSVQEIAEGKLRAEAIAKQSSDVVAATATKQESPASADKAPPAAPAPPQAPETQTAATPEPAEPVKIAATDSKTGQWINPDEKPATETSSVPAPSTPAPSSASAAPAPADAPIAGYGIQIASLRSEDDARQTWKSLTAAHPDLLGGLSPNIERADLGPDKGVFYRLRAGSFASRTDAQTLCGKLKDLNVGCFPISQ